MKQFKVVFTTLFCLCISFSATYSQSEVTYPNTLYSYQNVHKNHPDGTVGKLSFDIGSSYSSIKNQPGQPVVDAQKYQVGLSYVVADNFSERQSFSIIKDVQTTYQISIGFSYYLSSPLQKSANLNQDGKIGMPIISLDAILLLDDFSDTKSHTNYKTEILFPIAKSFSIFGGYTFYDSLTPTDVEKTFGGLHLYLSSNSNSPKYENPDAPLSGMAISLSGGNSDFGSFGQIELALPSSQSVTIKLTARGDFLEAPHDKAYTGSLQLFFYSGK